MIMKSAILPLVFFTSVFCQVNLAHYEWVHLDSIIYKSEQESLPYLFGSLIDSAHASLTTNYKKESEKKEGSFISSPFEKPKLFGMKNDKVISLHDYLYTFKSLFPDSCILHIEVDFDWQGNMTEAKLKRYKGKLNLKWDFYGFLHNLKAIPQKYSEIPLEHTKMIIPIRKK